MHRNKLNMKWAIVVSIIIVMFGSIAITFIVNNHQANMQIIDKCFDHLDKENEVIVQKENFWSPVSCEKS